MIGELALDPALRATGRIALALLLLRAAHHKLRDLPAFRAALADYRLLPEPWLSALAPGLAGAELAIALGLLLPRAATGAAIAAAAVLALYTGAIALNLLRGRRDIDCGCAGPGASRGLGEGLLLRNAVLIALAAATALPASPRGLVWLDLATIAGGAAVLALLNAAVEGLPSGALRLHTGRERKWSTP